VAWFLLGAFTLTLFQSALLLFWVQPMVGKILLPYLGGTPAVWNTCMVFFQGLLLGGYSYAHFLSSMSKSKQIKVHAGLLCAGLIPLVLLQFQIEPLTRSILPTPTESNPIPWLLAVLLFSAGVPFFAVSTTAPLLQRWFSSTNHPQAKDPYFLYAASNFGSMLTLICYPLVLEPNLTIHQQSFAWTIGYVVFLALVLICARLGSQNAAVESSTNANAATASPSPSFGTQAGWVALAFIPSSLMIGTTTHLTTDIAPMPLLWILPLALYLLSFILVFSSIPSWVYQGAILGLPLLACLAIAGAGDLLFSGITDDFSKRLTKVLSNPIQLSSAEICFFLAIAIGSVFLARSANRQHAFMIVLLPILLLMVVSLPNIREKMAVSELEAIFLHLGLLFVVSMVCHGELAKSRPDARHLTGFYLAMSLGGVLGGLFNTVLSPILFNRIVEYPLVGALACLIVPSFSVSPRWRVGKFAVQGLVFAIGFLVAGVLAIQAFIPREKVRSILPPGGWTGTLFKWLDPALNTPPLVQERNFFGAFRIEKIHYTHSYFDPLAGSYIPQPRIYHRMLHGTTNHGMQIFEPIESRREPITYFQRSGAIGQIFRELTLRSQEKQRLPRIAILGVGTGTLASYAEAGWALTLFEIDPAMVRYASQTDEYFTYMTDARRRGATVDVKLGDGRKVIEKHDVSAGKFDILFMDAFASDSVPVHLLTREAFGVYFDKLEEDGMVVVNIANRYLDFEPVLSNLAQSEGWRILVQRGQVVTGQDKYGTCWVTISRSGKAMDRLSAMREVFETNENEQWIESWGEGKAKPRLGVWTDSYSNIVNILNWGKE
jgi:predicted O-methyltransferase YrrM